MKRLWSAAATLLVVIPVALFAVFVWWNWGRPVEFPTDDPRFIKLLLPLYKAVWTGVPEALAGCFVFGCAMGVLATLTSFAARNRAWRDTISELKAERTKLAAANRALGAAVPVLRQRFDEAIGVFDDVEPPVPAATGVGAAAPGEDDLAAGVDIHQLAIEDARARRAGARR
jgi:hypothetical protein